MQINYASNIKTFRVIDPENKIKIGDIGQLTVKNNTVILTKSDGKSPLGIILKKVKIVDKKTRIIKRHAAKLLFSRCELETNNFDSKVRYPVNAPLFVNENGQFTTTQIESRPAVGMVIHSPTAINQQLQLIWF